MVAQKGILDRIEDGRGGDGSSLNLCFLIYPSSFSPFFNSFHVLTYTHLGLQAKEMVLFYAIDTT